jgi:hypothetical protein
MGEAKRRAARGEMPTQCGGHYDRDAEVRGLAAEMDQRVGQITAQSPAIGDRALIEQMLGFLPALQRIWTATSDDTLATLCSEYPGFYRYAKAMEDAFETQRRHPGQHPLGAEIEELPDSVKPALFQVMTQGATLEREMQDLVDRFEQHAMPGAHLDAAALGADVARARGVAELHQGWLASMDQLADKSHAAGVPLPSRQLLAKILGEMNIRIDKLNDRIMELALAGRASASARGTNRPTQ